MASIEGIVDVSCVVPCLNEEGHIRDITKRLEDVFDKESLSYEIIYVDDGSTDRTWQILREIQAKDPNVKAVRLNRNYGQHAATLAGFEIVKGKYIVTIDADLQNPPEEIPKLIAKAKEGYDVVGGWRYPRKDPFIRKVFSRIMNYVISKSIKIKMHDYGCMLRLYRRDVVDRILGSSENATFIPALGALFGSNVTEIKVNHEARSQSASRYNIFRLVRLNYDLMTGFSLLPIQALTFIGFGISFVGFALSLHLIIRSFFVTSVSGLDTMYTMFSVLYFFIGILILSIGIVGEYIGRIYMEVRKRPRYIVKEYAGHKS